MVASRSCVALATAERSLPGVPHDLKLHPCIGRVIHVIHFFMMGMVTSDGVSATEAL